MKQLLSWFLEGPSHKTFLDLPRSSVNLGPLFPSIFQYICPRRALFRMCIKVVLRRYILATIDASHREWTVYMSSLSAWWSQKSSELARSISQGMQLFACNLKLSAYSWASFLTVVFGSFFTCSCVWELFDLQLELFYLPSDCYHYKSNSWK